MGSSLSTPRYATAPLKTMWCGGFRDREAALAQAGHRALRISVIGALRQLGAAVVQDPPRDDQHVDLLRTLEDVVDLGVTHPFLN